MLSYFLYSYIWSESGTGIILGINLITLRETVLYVYMYKYFPLFKKKMDDNCFIFTTLFIIYQIKIRIFGNFINLQTQVLAYKTNNLFRYILQEKISYNSSLLKS